MAARRTFRRLITILGGGAAVLALAAAPASAAPGHGNAKGFLLLDNKGVVTAVAPGQAVKQANSACIGGANVVVATVDQVRAAFPAAFQVCTGVTLTSQVAGDEV